MRGYFKQVSEFLQHLKCDSHILLMLNKETAVLPRMS